jgi:hypothetical protein
MATQGQTFRTNDAKDGLAATYRFTYDPEWSKSKPWCVFYRGTATNQFPTLREALSHNGLSLNAFSEADQSAMRESL